MLFHPPCRLTQHSPEPNLCRFYIDLGVYNAEDSRFWDHGQRKECSKLGDFYLVTNLFPCQSLLHDNKTSLILYTLHANAPLRCTYLLTHLKNQQSQNHETRFEGKFDTRQAIFCACSKWRLITFVYEGAGSSKFYGHTAAVIQRWWTTSVQLSNGYLPTAVYWCSGVSYWRCVWDVFSRHSACITLWCALKGI